MSKQSRVTAIERMGEALEQIPKLKELSTNSPDFQIWMRNTRLAIGYAFGMDSDHVNEFCRISFYPSIMAPENDNYLSREENLKNLVDYKVKLKLAYVAGLQSAASLLESMLKEVEDYREDNGEVDDSENPLLDKRADNNKVFLVHGRDLGFKSEVARFTEKLGLEVVILDEQPNEGRTVIEKFEERAGEAGYAVILLSPDDEGRLKNSNQELKDRARQNVILELGYFAGVLGRKRACALMKGDLEIPSDYSGIIYIPYEDSGGWKLNLFRELRAAGHDVDANRVI